MPVPLLKRIKDTPLISRIRRNHGLEHATMHVLATRFPQARLFGHSDAGGFWLVGEVPTSAVKEATTFALQRIRNGESKLTVHAQCGTNFVTAGTLAGLAGALSMIGSGRSIQDKLKRLPLAVTLATLSLFISQPLGLLLQEHLTTSANPENLQIVEIIPTRRGRMKAHRIITRG
ncbi:MAG: DUF6391 domain-containing protein [Chloroflexota bacterium]